MDNTLKNSVLIVDDDKFNLEFLSSLLGQEYSVHMTKSGHTALDMAMEFIPDLILLDIIMPDIDGFNVLSMLKKSEKTKNIPVIIITGLENIEDEAKGLDLEAADYIHKPFNAKIVKLKVRNQMQMANQMKELIELQKKLALAVTDAEKANKAKSDFLVKMSHEIRTPLNAVIGISEMHLRNKTLQHDMKEAFSRIYNSGDLLLGLINDLLDISKIEAGKFELLCGQYNVSGMISDTVALNMVKYEKKCIEFIININENVPAELFGDEIRIKQVLNNLLSNAFKYTEAGEIELSLNAEPIAGKADADNMVMLVFRVRDTGQGLAEDQLAKLFDEYTRFNRETNKTIQGTGLGMGITQNLIAMMNGEIHAKSKFGEGTLITVRIPQGNVNALVLGKEAVEKLRQFRSNFEDKIKEKQIVYEPIPFGKVLIVDDTEMNLYVTRGLLSPYGLQIDTAFSGFEAIEKITSSYESSKGYDLVLMDHKMPVMDGIETTKRIRALGAKYEKLPVIALTANAISGMKNKFLENGFNGYISKPVNVQELDMVLKEWILPERITAAQKTGCTGAEANNTFLDAVNKISEINTKAGLHNLSGSMDLYRNTLEKFYRKLALECNNMNALLENKDINNFLISIHAMKSMLAIIGASVLSETAHELEIAAINLDIEYCMRKFGEYRNALFLLNGQLARLFPADHNSTEAENEPKTTQAAQNNDAGKVLIVDDVDMILYVMKNKLAHYGFQIDTATSGKEAIEKIANNIYDIVFMDYLMPEMDGFEATTRIRKWETAINARRNIIIALTADENPDNAEKFTSNGFNGYLSKPIDTRKLEEVLKDNHVIK